MRIVINKKDFEYFTEYNINMVFDRIANSFSFTAKKDLFDYFLEYPDCQIYDNDNNLLITGTVLAPNLNQTPSPEFISIYGYSKTGILEDCSIPNSIYPLQFDNLSLKQITSKILAPFGLDYKFDSIIATELNKKYTKIETQPGSSPKQLISDLAAQRNIFVSVTEKGELLFTRFKKTNPVINIDAGDFGLKKLNLNINSQALHSEITIVKQASEDNPDAGEYTIDNPYVEKYRPVTRVMDSGDIFDVKNAARTALSKELQNITINFDFTEFIKPGQTITLKAPELKLNNDTELMVQAVNITGNTKDIDLYSYSCVLVDVYTDNDVKNVFS